MDRTALFRLLAERGHDILRRIELTIELGLSRVPEAERPTFPELSAWFRQVEAEIDSQFGSSSVERCNWSRALDTCDDEVTSQTNARLDELEARARGEEVELAPVPSSAEDPRRRFLAVLPLLEDWIAQLGGARPAAPAPRTLPHITSALDHADAARLDRHVDRLLSMLDRDVRPIAANAAFMDTTSLHTFDKLVGERREPRLLTPLTLLDLANVVTSVVIYDRVLHLETRDGAGTSLARAIGDEAFCVPISTDATRTMGPWLEALWEETRSHIDHLRRPETHLQKGERAAVEAGWSRVLGRSLEFGDLFDPVEHRNWPSNGPDLLAKLAAVTEMTTQYIGSAAGRDPDHNADGVARALASECNHRSYFNHRLAGMLGLPYAASTARMPFRYVLYNQAIAVHGRAVALADAEMSRMAKTYAAPREPNVHLPMFLGAIVSRIDDLSSFVEVLADLRDKASPFRKRRAQLDQAIEAEDVEEITRLRDAVADDAKLLSGVIGYSQLMGTLAALLATLATGSMSVLATLAVVAVGGAGISDEARQRVKRRFLRPHHWFLTDTAATARALGGGISKLHQLWDLPDERRDEFTRRLALLTRIEFG